MRLFPIFLFDLTEVYRKHRESGHSLPVPKLSEEIPVLSFTLGKQIHFLWEFIKAVYYLSFLSFDVRHFLYVSSLTLVRAVLLNRLGHRQRHSEMFAVSKVHPGSFLGQRLAVSLTEQNIFGAYHTINNYLKQKY